MNVRLANKNITCRECHPVRIYGESGHRGDYHDAVELCPTHKAAPLLLEALEALVDNGFSDEQLATRFGMLPHMVTNARHAIRAARGGDHA